MPPECGAFRMDQAGPQGQVARRQQLRGADDAHGVRVGDVGLEVGEGELHRLDLQVVGQGGVQPGALQVQRGQHAQRHQGRDALAAGPDLVQPQPAVVHRQRRDPVACVRREVLLVDQAAGGARVVGDGLREAAPVEGVALALRDLLQRVRLPRAGEQLSRLRRLAARRESLAEAGLRQQFGDLGLPLAAHGGGHQEALARMPQGGLEQLGERDRPEPVRQRAPGRDRSWHRHGVPAAQRHGGVPGEVLRRPPARRAARGIEAVQPFAVPQDGEGVAADPVHARLHHRQRDRSGQRRIDRVAAARQHQRPGRGSQRLRGADHVARQQRHALRGVREVPEAGRACRHVLSYSSFTLACATARVVQNPCPAAQDRGATAAPSMRWRCSAPATKPLAFISSM